MVELSCVRETCQREERRSAVVGDQLGSQSNGLRGFISRKEEDCSETNRRREERSKTKNKTTKTD
jgi:hypothetical protein